MSFPTIGDSELVGLNAAGARVLATSSLMRRFYDRTRWLAEKKPTIHVGWSDGADCPAISNDTTPFTFSASETTVRTDWTIGEALVPAVGNATGLVRLYVRQHNYNSGEFLAGLRVRRAVVAGGTAGEWVDLGSFALGTTDTWRSGTFTVPDGIRDAPFDAWVYLTTWNSSDVSPSAGSVASGVSAWSLCSDGAAWPRGVEKFGHFRRQSGPPHDVFTLRLLRDYQDDAADVPRVLAHHSFAEASGVGVNWICRYVIPAPLHTGTLAIHVRCRTTGGSAATLYADLDTADTAGATVPPTTPTSSGSTAFTSSTMAWRTVTVTPTAGSTNYLWVWVDPAGGDTAQIEAVYATQADPADGAITRGVPGWRILPLATRDAIPGAAIVGSYSGEHAADAVRPAETVQNRWTDALAVANNAKWWPHARGSVTLPGDWVVTGDDYTDAFDSSSPAFGALSKIAPRWASTEVAVFARFTTDGVAIEADEALLAFATMDATQIGGGTRRVVDRGLVSPDAYQSMGVGAVASGTTSDLEIGAGYITPNGTPAAGALPARIEGVAAWELPASYTADLAHVRAYTASAASIPDNDAVTGVSSSVVITRAMLVKYPRVRVVITHANAAQLRMTLTDGTTTIRLADYGDLSGSGTQTFSFSDSYEDDTVPDQALSGFAGVSTADTWTLNVRDNAAGSTGTLDEWALELW